MTGRLTIGLFNSYDPRRFHEAHRRALARAAPLALAFDANLAAFGFPFDEGRKRERPGAPDLRTPIDVAKFVAESTSIGEGGAYFIELAEKGRFAHYPFPDPGYPPQLGEIVLTTSKPHAGKARTPAQIAATLASRKSVCLVFGLGPHGMPEKEKTRFSGHLDATGGGYSLETCTALGVVVGSVMARVEGAKR
ncbi:MAG: DUF531 family protein [Euryarchaeota archaeon]|nr:DUF531 family protein [Euryarchaeota archaeon]